MGGQVFEVGSHPPTQIPTEPRCKPTTRSHLVSSFGGQAAARASSGGPTQFSFAARPLVIMAQNPCYLLADASVAALWNSHCEAGSAAQGFPNCKHRLAFPILVPAWIELISTNGEWSNVKVMRHSPTDAHEDETHMGANMPY